METLFIADIGGTKSDLAVFSVSHDRAPLAQQRYINSQYSDPTQIIDGFLAESGFRPRFACLAVAAPIRGATVSLTNISWELDGPGLQKRYGWDRLLFINDLTAIGYSVLELQGDADLRTLQGGDGDTGKICGIVAPGTGLGEALLVHHGESYTVQGSQGGHCDFAPVDEEQRALLGWMQQQQMPVSYEMLVSGIGIPNLYRFCAEYLQVPSLDHVATAIAKAYDKTPAIVSGALLSTPCPQCSKAVDLFLSILGSEAGNLALKLYARGGIYLGGGILPRLEGRISFDSFLAGFRSKGEMSSLMLDFPVYLILLQDAALLGAARFARDNTR